MSILTDRLHQLGKNIQDLAAISGIDSATLYNYRNGHTELGIYKAEKISKAMQAFNAELNTVLPPAMLEVKELFKDVLDHLAQCDRDGYNSRGWHFNKGESRNARKRSQSSSD